DLLPAPDGLSMSQAITGTPSRFWSVRASRRLERTLTLHLPMALVVFFLLAPFYWMLITSLKPNSELYSPNGNPMWVFAPSLEHYEHLLTATEFPAWTKNTML